MTADTTDVERARAELAATLDAIRYRLNLPKRTAERIRRLASENPIAVAGAAAAIAAAIGGIVWGTVRLTRR